MAASGRLVGRVSVRVMPDVSRFKAGLAKSLEQLERSLTVKIPTALDTARLAAQAVAAKGLLESTFGEVVTRVNLDTTSAEAQIGAATRERAVTIRAKVDGGALATLGKLAGSAGQFASLAGSIAVAAHSATQLGAALLPAAGAVLALPAAIAVTQVAMATLRVATLGVAEAMAAAASGDSAALEESLKNLAPSAAAFVRAAVPIKSSFDTIQKAVQQRLFDGLAGQLRTLAGNLLPSVKTGMVGVAGSLNGMAKNAAATMSTPMFRGDLDKVFSGTTTVLNTVRGAVGPLITLVARLAVLGLPLVQRFTAWATSGIKAAAAFVSTERGAAQLAGVVQRAGDVLAQLGRIAANIGTFLANLFGGANTDGAGLLNTIEQLTARMSAWASSAQGQQQIAQVFSLLGQTASALANILPLLAGPLTTIAGLITSMPPGVQGTVASFLAFSVVAGALGSKVIALVAGLRTVGGGIAGLATQISTPDSKLRTFAAKLGEVAAGAGRAAVQVAAAGGRMAISMVTASASFVAAAGRMVASMALTAGRVVAGWVLMGAQALAGAARVALAWLIAMGPIGLIIAAVVALVAIIVANWDSIKAAIAAAWEWIKSATSTVWNAITSFLTSVWTGVKTLFTTYLNAVRTVVTTVWNGIKSATSTVWNGIKSFFTNVWTGIKTVFTTYINAVRTVVTTVWNGIKSVTSTVWNGIKSFITNLINGVKTVITTVLNTIKATWTTAWNTARTIVTTAWNRIKTAVTTAITSVLTTVRSIPGKITSALGNLGNLLYNAGKNVIQGLINGIKGMIGSVGSAMKDIAAKIREYLPFSPAKAGPLKLHPPDEGGRTIAKMLAGGIDSGQHLVARAASGLASATLPNVSADHLVDPAADGGESSGGARFVIHNHYPQAEPTSTTTNRALQYAAALGVV